MQQVTEVDTAPPALAVVSPLPACLDDFLATNVAPVDMERTSLQSILEDRRFRTAGLVSQIAAVQLQLQRLVQQQREADEQISQLTTVLAPVRRIPNEILCEIFLWAAKHHRGRVGLAAPWHLGHISSHWRAVALSFPPLWSSFTVHDRCADPPNVRKTRLAAQLTRSADAPLSIRLWWSEQSEETEASLIRTLVSQSPRWKNLIVCPSGDVDTFFSLLQPVKWRLGKLEKLHCQFYSPLRKSVDIFLHLPNLQHLNFMVQHNHLRLSWGQVINCYMEGLLCEHLENLGEAHNLVDLHLNVDHEGLIPGSMVTLPNLRRLCIVNTDGLSHFTAPKLERLNASTEDLDFIPPFLQRSNCQLSVLVLFEEDDTEITMPDLISVLRCVPSLGTLLILARACWPGFRLPGACPRIHDLHVLFTAMTLSGSLSDLLPRLSTLFFRLEQNPFTGDAFLTMVRSRLLAQNPHRLTHVVVEDTLEPFLDDEDLNGLTGQGLRFEWMDFGAISEVEESYFPR
ncbi:hypothetical protein C8F01DRAFT_1169939 [Mycena amicta]|nr:hypothetical protein C8F01DRAFT_1169939 [Mycena amicta]